MKLVLQNIIFPSQDFNDTKELFFRYGGGTETNNINAEYPIVLNKGESISTDTYYNAFSIEKWLQYTICKSFTINLKCEGSFKLEIINKILKDDGDVEVNNLIEQEYKDNYSLNIPTVESGIICFNITSLENGVKFLGGEIITEIEKENETKIALNICTYKREKFVERNIGCLEEKIFKNKEYKDYFKAFIIDNGKSLDIPSLDKNITIFQNKNTGGSGGFTRGIIEILNTQEKEKFSHILFMDDDIVFSEEALIRTLNLLRTLKKEYISAFVCGGMITLENKYLQTELTDYYTELGHKPIKHNYDLRELKNVLDNEKGAKANYCSWWYCCMPMEMINKDNLPLPLFIKRDDVEYGLRNGTQFITLNGISVLHEDFNKKRTGYLEYYYWRNQCIINAIHYDTFTKSKLKKMLFKRVIKNILTYRYNDGNLMLKGIEDYLKGIDFIKENDALKINNKIRYFTYRVEDIDDLKDQIITKEELIKAKEKYIYDKKGGKKELIKGMIKWLIKGHGIGFTTTYKPLISDVAGKKCIVNFSKENDKIFVTKKSYQKAINLILNYFKISRLINKKYKYATLEYKNRYKEITNIDFWNKYLTEEIEYNDKTILKSEEFVNYKKAMKDFIIYNIVSVIRFFEHLICLFIPIKKNKVTFILNRKSGLACNIKYLINNLKEKHGDKIDIALITGNADNYKDEAKEYKVYKKNTIKSTLAQLNSKVVITNDFFQELATNRKNQFFINTWHGAMNYKHIGTKFLDFCSKSERKRFIRRNFQPDLFISGSEYFTNDTFYSFGFDKDVFINSGLPRNDLLFNHSTNLENEIREKLGINKGDKVILYAPTFRKLKKKTDYNLDIEQLITTLNTKFGGEWKILFRSHYFVEDERTINDSRIIDVSNYPDINELIIISNVLITDYSSCMWDFSLGKEKKPVFIYAPDLDYYMNGDRTLSYPVEKWPFSIAITNNELNENILKFNKNEYVKRVENHLKECNSYDDGNATKRIVEIIESKLKISR
ncbi:MAG: CDP-glycerol glycerophosphotransferase family protein [Clostridia bacterium]|nr:CDP-glycerol glycerophosphotransferase family protein [Clostridia bacterium]